MGDFDRDAITLIATDTLKLDSITTTNGTNYVATQDWTFGPYEVLTSGYVTTTPTEKRREGMRSLFRVFAVNPKTDKVEVDELVVAGDGPTALIKALTKAKVDLDEVDTQVFSYGCFIQPKDKVKQVQVVKD